MSEFMPRCRQCGAVKVNTPSGSACSQDMSHGRLGPKILERALSAERLKDWSANLPQALSYPIDDTKGAEKRWRVGESGDLVQLHALRRPPTRAEAVGRIFAKVGTAVYEFLTHDEWHEQQEALAEWTKRLPCAIEYQARAGSATVDRWRIGQRSNLLKGGKLRGMPADLWSPGPYAKVGETVYRFSAAKLPTEPINTGGSLKDADPVDTGKPVACWEADQ